MSPILCTISPTRISHRDHALSFVNLSWYRKIEGWFQEILQVLYSEGSTTAFLQNLHSVQFWNNERLPTNEWIDSRHKCALDQWSRKSPKFGSTELISLEISQSVHHVVYSLLCPKFDYLIRSGYHLLNVIDFIFEAKFIHVSVTLLLRWRELWGN